MAKGVNYLKSLDGIKIDIEIIDDYNIILTLNKVIYPYVRHRFAGGRAFDPLSAYKKKLRGIIREAIYNKGIDMDVWGLREGAVHEVIEVELVPAISLSISNRFKMIKGEKPALFKPDLDNYEKTMNDVLVNTFWVDDAQINQTFISKKWSEQEKTTVKLTFFEKVPDSGSVTLKSLSSKKDKELYNRLRQEKIDRVEIKQKEFLESIK